MVYKVCVTQRLHTAESKRIIASGPPLSLPYPLLIYLFYLFGSTDLSGTLQSVIQSVANQKQSCKGFTVIMYELILWSWCI